MENDSLDSAGSVVKPPAVAARSFPGLVGLLKVNPQKANPNVLGRDALSVVNAQSLRSSTRRRVDARLAEVPLQHIRREEELKLKALAAAQELRKLESEQIVLQAEKEVAEANILADATSSCDGELDDVAPPLEAGDMVGAFLLNLSLSDQVDGPNNSNGQKLVPHEERLTMGSPDGTKVKSKCTFSPEVGHHAEPAVRTSSTSRHPPGFPPPTCIPGTIVSPSFGVDAMDPARFSLGPVPSGMFHGPGVAPKNLNPVNGHGVTSKVDVVEPPIHGPAITRERSQGRYGTDLGLPGESVHSLSDVAKMLVSRRCSRKHHSLLHQPSEVTGDEETTLRASKGDTTPGLPSNQASTSALSAASNTQVKTRLQVPPICVINNITGTCKDTLALLDSGADCHLISEGLYTKRGLVGRPIHSEMQLANGGIESLETFSTDCTVRGVLEDNEFVLENVRVVPRLPDLSSSRPSPEDVDGCPYLAGIEIPKVEADCVQLILGIDSPALHTFSEIRQDGNSKLWAGKSLLGWVLHGRDGTNGRDSRCSVNLLVDSQVTPALDSLCPCQFDYVDRANVSEDAVEVIRKNIYVDDLSTSAPDVDSAVKLVHDVEALLQGGGFELAKLSSNLPEVLKGLPAKRLASELNQVDLSPEIPKQKTLGLVLYPQEDVLGVKVSEVAYPVTRRGLLSLVMSIFDPLGFLSPFLLPLKLLLQRLVKFGYDADMPKAEKQTLRKFSKHLLKLGEISIPRCLGGFSSLENVQLHVFADASSVGIGAVCYLRVSNANNCFVSFMMGKSRVAPAKPLTIPRLELCAAGIAVRLAKFVTRELDVTPEKTVFWSDSTTVLSYLQSTSKRRPVFETNRIKHRKSGHNAAAYVTNELRRRFYIVGQERTVKHLIKTYCMGCRNRRAAPSSQIMSPLPRARVEGGQRLFTVVGTDFMGPILTKCQRNSLKRYCCIFTCLASRATHLEIAYDLTTGSFLMALRRFLAARGSSTKTIYCDNGTNFIGARSELKRGLERLRRREICNELSPRGIAFRHSPPLASHQGGVWEAILRLVRKAMDAVLTDKYYRKLSDEGLWTLLKEIEYMLNCRPLTRVSSDPEDFRALSPMTLLNGCIDPQLPSDVFVNSDGLRASYRASQMQADLFWQRWRLEYLSMLQKRHKWIVPRDNIRPNSLVLLKEEDVPRNSWPKGVVVSVIPDRDGICRRAVVRTVNGKELVRDIRKLCVLECDVSV